jgi:endonuclease/exonuclease/phosphatase family metal-dependent hydrolase
MPGSDTRFTGSLPRAKQFRSPRWAAGKSGNAAIRIGTFNIRMFPCNENCECIKLHGYRHCVERGRPTTDLRRLADTIITLKPDILAVNEILNPDRLARFAVEHLGPEWRFVHAHEGGRQKVGFLYDSSVVRLLGRKAYSQIFTALTPEEHSPLCFKAGDRLRPAFACRFQVAGTGLDFFAVVLHLKPGECSSVRRAQWRIMEQVVDELAKVDSDIVILGDFNDDGRGERDFSEFCRRKKFTLVTDAISCTHSMGSSPDNILVSEAAAMAFHKESVRVGGPCARSCGRTALWRAYLNRVSDHCPVVAEFRAVAPQ